MSANQNLQPNTQNPEDDRAGLNHPQDRKPLQSPGDNGNNHENAESNPSDSLETSPIYEEGDEEWDPSVIEGMLVEASAETETAGDRKPIILEQALEEDSDKTEDDESTHPGWSHVLSPPLSTSQHSTPPEVMRWVKSPEIHKSLQYVPNNTQFFMIQSACIICALDKVDYSAGLSAYKFPYAARGGTRVARSLPRSRRQRTPRLEVASRKEAETLTYTPLDHIIIQQNVRRQLSELEVRSEVERGSTPESPDDGAGGHGGHGVSTWPREDARANKEDNGDVDESSRASKRAIHV